MPWDGNKLIRTTRYCTCRQVCIADSWDVWNSRNFRQLFYWTSRLWLKTILYGLYEGSSTLWPLSLTQCHFFLSSLPRRLTLQFQPSKLLPGHCSVLDAFAILWKPTISVVMSVCLSVRPSARNISAPSGRNFMKFCIWVFFENPSWKFKFH